MHQKHEYSMIGHSRATIGRWLGVVSGMAAGAVTTLAGSALMGHIMGWVSLQEHPVSIPVSAATFYVVGHFCFDRWLWKKSWVQKLLGIPDLNGKWQCAGETLDPGSGVATYHWAARVTITQTWEKIKVHLETATSRSHSVAASIVKNDDVGFVLMYSYRNEPKPGEPELKAHIGYCELHVETSQSRATGTYFNSGGRLTYGRMTLTKEAA